MLAQTESFMEFTFFTTLTVIFYVRKNLSIWIYPYLNLLDILIYINTYLPIFRNKQKKEIKSWFSVSLFPLLCDINNTIVKCIFCVEKLKTIADLMRTHAGGNVKNDIWNFILCSILEVGCAVELTPIECLFLLYITLFNNETSKMLKVLPETVFKKN